MTDRHLVPPYSLRTPKALRTQLECLATANGQSLNGWLHSTLAKQFVPGSPESRGIDASKLQIRHRQLAYDTGDLSSYSFRMTLELRIHLDEAAKRSDRSLNKEIIHRLLCALSDADFQQVSGAILKKYGSRHLGDNAPDSVANKSPELAETESRLAIGDRLKAERKRLSRTQGEIASDCGISREVWCRYERGVTLPGTKLLQAFVKAGANPEFLLTGEITQICLSSDEKRLLDLFRKSPQGMQEAALRVLNYIQP